MATPYKKPAKEGFEGDVTYHRIRITLTSRNVKALERGSYHLFFVFYISSLVLLKINLN
jgi:hypothetical protein